jgi:hypothetical protein
LIATEIARIRESRQSIFDALDLIAADRDDTTSIVAATSADVRTKSA